MIASKDAGSGSVRGLGRWIGVALVVSLCVNLLVAGAVASSFWSLRKSGGGSRGDDGGGQFARFARSLPPERREAIRAATTGARATIAPLRQEARAAREDFNRQLAADVFDRQKLAAAHLREIETEAEVRRAVSRVMMDVAATMTAEERRAFAQWREQRTPGRGGRRGGREPEPK